MNTHAIARAHDNNGVKFVFGTQQAVIAWFNSQPGRWVTAKEYGDADLMMSQLAYHKSEQPEAQYVEIA